MRHHANLFCIALILVIAACGEEGSGLPLGGSAGDADGSDEGDADGTASGGCGEQWIIDDDGVANAPDTCMAWSPRSDFMMGWKEAASIEEGEEGGCGSDCPEEDSAYCASLGSLGGRSDWRLPSKQELMDAAKTNTENMTDVDGKLWSRDTDATAPGNAWTVSLGSAGAYFSMDKEDASTWVRCVSEG